MPTFSREQIQSARLQARVKRQEEIDQKHAEIARIREEGGDTEALERELEKPVSYTHLTLPTNA